MSQAQELQGWFLLIHSLRASLLIYLHSLHDMPQQPPRAERPAVGGNTAKDVHFDVELAGADIATQSESLCVVHDC